MNKKTVIKPWGKEVWLELNEFYCYKRIYLNKGERTSLQYHVDKVETNYIIEGEAEIWLEDNNGEIQKTKMGKDEYFTVFPELQHRVVALTDLILQEVSTPQVDDVIRVQDDFHRTHGRIATEHMTPALFVLAAGQGTRMGHLVDHTYKGLLPVNDKAIISHIVDKTPKEYDIIMGVGKYSDLIQDYFSTCYPDRNFTFVHVDKEEGEGTGPGYSILQAKEHLQRPFYFITADCLFDNPLPKLDTNWLGVYPTSIPELYSTVEFDGEMNITDFVNKSTEGFDHAFIGLAGIVDYESFWHELEAWGSENGEIVAAFYDPRAYEDFKVKKLDWVDVGTLDSYLKVRDNRYSLPKTTGEAVYRVKDRCVKLFPNFKALNLMARSLHLHEFVPPNCKGTKHTLSYDWIHGDTLYTLNNIDMYRTFLRWAKGNMWSGVEAPSNAREIAKNFYFNKTKDRLDAYLKSNTEHNVVNGILRLSIDDYLTLLDWELIFNVEWTRKFHGDLQFDNILRDSHGFYLIDWRESFGGSTEYGDLYYDFAKLYGGTLIDYSLMKDANNVSMFYSGEEVEFSYQKNKVLTEFLPYLENWILDNDYSVEKVKIITALIFLNMAPLHEKPFSDMLFYKAKEMLGEIYDR